MVFRGFLCFFHGFPTVFHGFPTESHGEFEWCLGRRVAAGVSASGHLLAGRDLLHHRVQVWARRGPSDAMGVLLKPWNPKTMEDLSS